MWPPADRYGISFTGRSVATGQQVAVDITEVASCGNFGDAEVFEWYQVE